MPLPVVQKTAGHFPMSNHYINAILEAPNCSSSEKLILLVLANRANQTGVCWPSFGTLVRETSLSRRTVIRTIAALESKKFLSKKKTGFQSNKYHLLVSQWHSLKGVSPRHPLVSPCPKGVPPWHKTSATMAPYPKGTLKNQDRNGEKLDPEWKKKLDLLKSTDLK